MNSSTWKSLLDDSNNLNKPTQAKQLISTKDITEINLLLIKVLRGFLAKEDLHVGLKTYINNVWSIPLKIGLNKFLVTRSLV